jgi:hypothetical protein
MRKGIPLMATKTEPTTSVALRDGSGMVDVRESFAERFPAIAPTPEMMEVFQENLGDEELGVRDFKRIKVPSGELDSWMVTRAGTQRAVKELIGVVIAIKARRSYWESNEPDGSFPDCFSSDGKTPDEGGRYHASGELGHLNPTGLCRNCPMAQRGSDPKSEKGQACREQRLLFFATDGAMFPVVVVVPRTSVRKVVSYAMDLSEDQLPYFAVETGLGLVKAKSSNNQTYNQVELRMVGPLSDDERRAAQVYGLEIKAMIDAAVADFTDSGTAEAAGDGGISVGDGPTG